MNICTAILFQVLKEICSRLLCPGIQKGLGSHASDSCINKYVKFLQQIYYIQHMLLKILFSTKRNSTQHKVGTTKVLSHLMKPTHIPFHPATFFQHNFPSPSFFKLLTKQFQISI